MSRLSLPLLALLLLLGGGLTRTARADDVPPTPEEEERLEAIERHTKKGWEAFRTGNHEEVLARMQRLAKYDPDSPLPRYLTARVKERIGAYEEALDGASQALLAHPDDERAEELRFRALFAVGRHDEAATAARARLGDRPADLVARTALGICLEERGRREEALAEYDKVLAHYNANPTPPEEAPWIADAAVRATWLSPNPADDMLQQAIGLMQKHLAAHPEDLDAKLRLADLFQADRGAKGQQFAGKYYTQILKENTEVAEARVGRARSALLFYQQSRALEELERALQTNPNLVPALSLRAAIHVGNGDYERGEKDIARALAVNPRDKETRAVKAALLWIRGEKAAFEALRDEVLAYDPTYGALYRICADLVGERQRRYQTAEELAAKAIEVDPRDRAAYVVRGEALMNRGRTDEALQVFLKGREVSKGWHDVRRDNWIEVLRDWMPKFKTLETKHFRIRMALEEWNVMQHYLPDLLEEAHDVLTRKYGQEVEQPTFADAFNRADDFSVRSVGSPGLPALGVCFGNTLTLLGPTAMPVGKFSWSRTAWHEFAHVVTLQQSKGQVPRWLTEGLSVFEERQRRDRWGRDMERQLYNRWRNDRLLKMATINQAFRGPDILFAYYQGGLIADHLMQERGFEVIPKMLKAFAEDRSTAQVFQDVLGLDLARYDQMFHDYVGTIVGDYKIVPMWDADNMRGFLARVQKDPKDAEAWIRLAWGHYQHLRLIDAGAALLKARQLAPDAPEVVLLQGRMAEGSDRRDVARREYERFLAAGGDDMDVHLFLAQEALRSGGDSTMAVGHLQAAKRCFPRYIGRDSPYVQLAKLYRGEGDMEKAMGELEAYAAIAAESYDVRRELKSWYKSRKDAAAVARVCEEMVDITPFGANVSQGEEPDLELHRDYAAALETLGRGDEALRELEVQAAIGRLVPEEKRVEAGVVRDLVALGSARLDRGQAADALAQAIAALRIAPQDASALMLKRRAQEAGGER